MPLDPYTSPQPTPPDPVLADPILADPIPAPPRPRSRILPIAAILILILATIAWFAARHSIRKSMAEALPQLDGSILLPGLAAPVTVERDAHGVPYLHASSVDDLIFAQGYVTAQDRLWQMEVLRRHAAGELSEILGPSMLDHDRLQRTLQVRAAADRAIAVLPADQKHFLDLYAAGVNAFTAQHADHLPLEFHILQFKPASWTARDSLLVQFALFQDLTTAFPEKLGRENLTAHLPADLIADLYPVGSWRDHPPDQPVPDLTAPQPEFNDIPLDESQTRLREGTKSGAPHLASEMWVSTHTHTRVPHSSQRHRDGWVPAVDLASLNQTLSLFHQPCPACTPGSNAWAVAGSRTASGKPILSNDMHLAITFPSLWYEAVLEADNAAPLAGFHVAGVTIPGVPFVVAGHNAHIAWGYTNLGADVQDIYIETTRGTPTGPEYETPDGAWHPLLSHTEVIHVRGSADVTLNVPLTHHGAVDTPVISSLFPNEKRTLSLRWTAYDPANVTSPGLAIDSATDWPTLLAAFRTYGGPPENLVAADDQGHIGYHAVGPIPLRGTDPADPTKPGPLSPVPIDAVASGTSAREWSGTIPFDQLPQATDPTDGILATANARVTRDGYPYPITLNWMAPYRTERIYKILEAGHNLTPADMLTLQTDVFSVLDQLIAQRLAYSIDHTSGPLKNDKTLHQAADLLRNWNGNVDANAAGPAIVNAARAAFWPMLLLPKYSTASPPPTDAKTTAAREAAVNSVYIWGERAAVEEQLVMHTPARWLPPGYANWEDFLAAVTDRGLRDAHAPKDLSTWSQGAASPVDLEHPIFSRSPLFPLLVGVPIGTGPQPQSGDATTVRQVHGGPAPFGPSQRFTADLSDPDRTTLNIVLGQSGNISSPNSMDQFQAWLHGRTFPFPFTAAAFHATTTHTLILRPR